MIAALLLAQAIVPTRPDAAPPAPAGDVVVTAERLRKLRLSTSLHDGKLVGCSVAVSSGDPQIDFEACGAMRQCFAEGATDADPLANCIDRRIGAYIKDRAAIAAGRNE